MNTTDSLAVLASHTIGVIGSGTDAHATLSTSLGQLLARLEVNLLTGGGGGVMAAVAEAFIDARPPRGISVGVLPASQRHPAQPPPGYPNRYVQFAIATHLPDRGRKGHLPTSRNHINVLTPDAIVALPGRNGTLSELQLALEYGRPVIIYCPDASLVEDFPSDVPRVESIDGVETFLRNTLGVLGI